VSLYALNDVLVNDEALIFKRGRIHPESFMARYYGAPYRTPAGLTRFLTKNYVLRHGAVRVPSGLWVIDNLSHNNWHHWLIDVLTRLIFAERLYPDERVVLLPGSYRHIPYVQYTLRAFPQIDEIAWIGSRAKVRVKRLAFVPRSPVYLREPILEIARRLRELVGERGTARRVYFSRADARRRRATNEAEVIRVLRSHDFEVLEIDPAKPWEQIRAGMGAELMAGIHGAALTNLIFMRAGAQLLELRHGRDEVFQTLYGELAALTGVGYRSQICEVAGGATGWEINDENLIVDLDKLRENLSRAIEAVEISS
jgi:capsular polysaccharide biosynthesis protein